MCQIPATPRDSYTMHTIDPDSPLESTICGLCRERHSLGETDCDGEPVGYIIDGCCFTDRAERDRAIGGGRCIDAWSAWNRTGGALGTEPNYPAILAAYDVLPQHESDCMRELETHLELMRMSVRARAVRATWN